MHTRTLSLILILFVPLAASAGSKRRAASPDRCSTTATPASLSFPASGGQATIDVNVTGGCTWTPVASDSWIAAVPMGNQVSVDVGASGATTTRTGLIHIRGAVVVVTQAANPQLPNLLNNPGFDNGLAYWSEAFSGPGSAIVGSNSPIASPGPSSNAALITSTDVRSGHQLSQCVSITGGKRYEAGARVLIPAGQSAGVVNFAVYEYWVANCTVSAGYHGSRILSANQPIGSWFDQSVTWSTDFSAKSVLVVIGAGGTNEPPFAAWFDDIYIREKP